MIAFYLLVSVLPFVQHPLWSLFVGSLTMVKITGLICIAYALLYVGERRSPAAYLATWQNRWAVTLCLVGMASYLSIGASVPLELSPFLSYASFLSFLFVTATLIDSVDRLRWTLLTVIGSMGYASLHVIREWQKAGFGSGYRPGWVTGDPNYFSLSALLCLPFAFYLLRPRQPRWERSFCVVCLGLILIGHALAASRGGLLGLAASVLMVAWRSRHRAKVLAAAALLLAPIILLSPTSPVGRLLSPTFSDQESSDARLMLWGAGIRMVTSNPLTGIGVGNFKPMLPRYLLPGENTSFIAHNTYLEIGAELGIPALLVFLGIIVATFLSTRQIRRRAKTSPTPTLVIRAADATQVGMVGYAVAIFFVSAEYQKLFWLVVFLSSCLPALARARRSRASWWARGTPEADTSTPILPGEAAQRIVPDSAARTVRSPSEPA